MPTLSRALARSLSIAAMLPLAAACTDRITEPVAARESVARPAASVSAVSDAIGYTVHDLDVASTRGAALAISNSGIIVGRARVTADLEFAFRVANGVVQPLGGTAEYPSTAAYAVNESGMVGGGARPRATLQDDRAFTWHPSGIIQETYAEAGGTIVYVVDNAGTAYGATAYSYYEQPFRKPLGGALERLPLPAGPLSGVVRGANASGVLVGYGFDAKSDVYPIRWVGTVASVLPLPAGWQGRASSINDAGEIVGAAYVRGIAGQHLVRWNAAGEFEDLGTAEGYTTVQASDINASGQMAGYVSGANGFRGFIYTPGVGFQLLPSLGIGYDQAFGLNDNGDVVGLSYVNDTTYKAVVWRRSPNHEPVANAGGPYTGLEGAPITFNGGGSTDPDGDALTYEWNFNDDSPLMYGKTVSRNWSDNGTYYVTLRVTDPHGASSEHHFTVTIRNVAPTIKTIVLDMGMLNRPRVGQVWPLTVRWTDPGPTDGAWQWTIEWGDGTTSSGSKGYPNDIAASHAYATAGAKTARITIRDKDGGVATRTIPVSVQP